jgi:SAM-dependent methyltransferase
MIGPSAHLEPLAIGDAQGMRHHFLATCADRTDIRDTDQLAILMRQRPSASAAMGRPLRRTRDRYLFPRHPGETHRLDVQHYALRETLRANFVAPVHEPRRVLDVGCGTGQWAFEICEQFPEVVVVGLDLVAGKAEHPWRYRFVKGNLLHGLPLADDCFDFVHQRFLLAGVPLASWGAVVADLARVTQPGGWVELTEIPWVVEGAGPATERLLILGREMAVSLGLDDGSVVFNALDGYLQRAGLYNVVRREFSIPIGEWGGRVGSLMATDGRAAFTRLCEVLQARSRLRAEDSRDLIRQALAEWENGRMSTPCAVAFGRKALGTARAPAGRVGQAEVRSAR